MVAPDRSRTLALAAARVAIELAAHDVIVFDVSDNFANTHCIVIGSAATEEQVRVLTAAVEKTMLAAGIEALRGPGTREGRWALLGFENIVVHVQHDRERAFYGLDKVWTGCPRIEIPGTADEPAPTAGGSPS